MSLIYLLLQAKCSASQPDNAPDIGGGGKAEDEADQEDGGRSPLELAPLAVIEVGGAHFDEEGNSQDHVQSGEDHGVDDGLDLPGSRGPGLLDGPGDVASGGEGGSGKGRESQKCHEEHSKALFPVHQMILLKK